MNNKKDNNRSEITPKNNGNNAFDHFDNNSNFVSFMIKRTEKVAAALYIVTELFHEEEPLRRHIRQSALNIMQAVFLLPKYRKERQSEQEIKLSFTVAIHEIKSLVFIAKLSKVLGEMNALILENELKRLGAHFDEFLMSALLTHAEQNSLLSADFFHTEPEALPKVIKDNLKDTANDFAVSYPKGHDDGGSKGQFNLKDKQTNGLKNNISGSNEERKASIIELIKQKGEITIKDASRVIKGCSEKTIQRELLTLVGNGVLKKVGERRWSKYLLV